MLIVDIKNMKVGTCLLCTCFMRLVFQTMVPESPGLVGAIPEAVAKI